MADRRQVGGVAGGGVVRVVGLKDLERRIDKLSEEGREALAGALNDHAKKVVKGAKSRAPVRTGKLKRSIKQTQKARQGKMIATVHATVPQASIVEFGSVKTTERPFMRPAFDAVETEIDNEVERILDSFL